MMLLRIVRRFSWKALELCKVPEGYVFGNKKAPSAPFWAVPQMKSVLAGCLPDPGLQDRPEDPK